MINRTATNCVLLCILFRRLGPKFAKVISRPQKSKVAANKKRVKLLSACCEFDPLIVNNVEIWNDILFVSTILECQIFDSWCDRGKPIEQDDAQRYYKRYCLF